MEQGCGIKVVADWVNPISHFYMHTLLAKNFRLLKFWTKKHTKIFLSEILDVAPV